jgi:hypothetical protein
MVDRPNMDTRQRDDSESRSSAQLANDNARLRQETARLQEDNDDLRASAFYWKQLYEAAVKRANDLEEGLAGVSNA